MSCKPRHLNKIFSFLSVSLGGSLAFATICLYRGDEDFYSRILMRFTSRCQDSLSQEQAAKLRTNVFDLKFSNPIGLAAGFDKDSQAIRGLSYYGLGFAEVGTVTPKPQDGNPKKRIFRALQDRALINRCGFNNKGIDYVVDNLSKVNSFHPMLVGLNLGKNKDTKNISSDYLIGIEKSQNIDSVDYLVVNISSPNTPGLRDLQDKDNLELLLDDILSKMNSIGIKKPLLVKVAPDLTQTQIKEIVSVITKKKCGRSKVSGIILTNTTTTRPSCNNQDTFDKSYDEIGGMSGKPLRDMSTKVISEFYKLTNGKLPIIGVGGVTSGQDAYDKIKAGASLIQLYTSLTYEGPPIINKIKRELVQLLEQDEIESISDAVGLDHRKGSDIKT